MWGKGTARVRHKPKYIAGTRFLRVQIQSHVWNEDWGRRIRGEGFIVWVRLPQTKGSRRGFLMVLDHRICCRYLRVCRDLRLSGSSSTAIRARGRRPRSPLWRRKGRRPPRTVVNRKEPDVDTGGRRRPEGHRKRDTQGRCVKEETIDAVRYNLNLGGTSG